MSETKMLQASDIIKNPQILDNVNAKYQIIYDQSKAHVQLDKLNTAINIMTQKGWRCISITGSAMWGAYTMYALMERQF